ncbi:hypothetical protein ACFV0R_15665 [Streptomyces sp. NPDC059578]|uniref:hypothetical protein n=1 Tax=Streptomyces sp. NPDC059578 TaxID=3346874 RepID=UPI00368E100C
MTPVETAMARGDRLPPSDRVLYVDACTRGLNEARYADTYAVVAELAAAPGGAARVAGYLEGLAAARRPTPPPERLRRPW